MNKSENQLPGIYLHIPFCKKACHYCNFHFSTSLQHKAPMLDAICKEIALTPPYQPGETIATIYFGGGTPSLLNKNELTALLDALRTKFEIAPGAEITLEANPDDINAPNLAAWQDAGINRLSIGIQSFREEELQWMNRAHNATQAADCLQLVKDAGFTNFSVDLIYGSPLLNDDQWKKNTDTIIAAGVPHISCYALTVEPHTALDTMIAKGKKAPVDPERQAQQFLLLMDWLQTAGYAHYEISNFALPGKRSLHNSSYWQGRPYYGFGPSAHSYDRHRRRWNIANNARYIEALQQNKIPFEEELLTTIQQLNEYIMISLRTMEGLDTNKLASQFGKDYRDTLLNAAERYRLPGHLLLQDERLVLTKSGKLLADGIAADLFFEEEKD